MVKPYRKPPNVVRSGIKDAWNAFMVQDAVFCDADIPFCPTTASAPPKQVLSWPKAKSMHAAALTNKDFDYHIDAFIHFFEDDDKFDGPCSGIWADPESAISIIKHFDGMITPDYSTYQDFPEPIKLYSTYCMRAFGYWAGVQGVNVINNVRWGTKETWRYSFSGIPKHSIICIGTLGGSPRKLADRSRFNLGFEKMLEKLEPSCIVVVGSANYPCFSLARNAGIEIVSFKSETSQRFSKKASHE